MSVDRTPDKHTFCDEALLLDDGDDDESDALSSSGSSVRSDDCMRGCIRMKTVGIRHISVREVPLDSRVTRDRDLRGRDQSGDSQSLLFLLNRFFTVTRVLHQGKDASNRADLVQTKVS